MNSKITNMDNIKTPKENEKDGKRAYQAKEYDKAARAFEGAAEGFFVAGDQLTAAEMRNNQAVALLQDDRPKEALKALEGTEDIFSEAGDKQRQAMALGNRASTLEELGELEKALTTYQESAKIFQEISAQEEYAQIMQFISGIKLRLKNPMGALASMQNGLDNVERPNLKQRLVKRLLKMPNNFLK